LGEYPYPNQDIALPRSAGIIIIHLNNADCMIEAASLPPLSLSLPPSLSFPPSPRPSRLIRPPTPHS
jgi:hypothetical protein